MKKNTFSQLRKPIFTLLALFVLAQPLKFIQAQQVEVAPESIEAPQGAKAARSFAVASVSKPTTVQKVFVDVCLDSGYGQDCAQTLLGMLWKESRNVNRAIGDRGNARGYFQIWTKLHKVSVECAEDLRCSAEWTLRRMEQYGYPKYVKYAVQCHNGCGIANGYAASAIRWGKTLWDEPMPADAIERGREVALK
ncbi:MAG: hypothetical protein AAB692_01450 [Patescibacteria group bacterium]